MKVKSVLSLYTFVERLPVDDERLLKLFRLLKPEVRSMFCVHVEKTFPHGNCASYVIMRLSAVQFIKP